MAIRLLVTNGDSYTRGRELTDPERDAWPVVLADILDADVVNLAQDGSSNRRIVRSTTLALEDIRTEAGVGPDEVLVLLAWSQLARDEYYSSDEPPDQREPRPHDEVDLHWRLIGHWRRSRPMRWGRWTFNVRHRPTSAFYKHLWSKEGQLINFAVDWLLLDGWLRSNGYQARYAFALPFPERDSPSASSVLQQLDGDAVFGGLPSNRASVFHTLASELPLGPEGHPLVEGHALLARTLADWLSQDSTVNLRR